MEHVIQLHIEKLPEGLYLATSDDVQGLLAQGRTILETIEIARDVASKLIGAQSGKSLARLLPVRESFDYPLIVATRWAGSPAAGEVGRAAATACRRGGLNPAPWP
jgi:predicted RNase H-like HicB family nuclease